MKLSNKLSLIATVCTMLFACGETTSNTANTIGTEASMETSTESGSSTSSNNFRYGIKSGILTYKITVMGINTDVTTYFEDYGDKEATISKAVAKMMGMTINTETKTISKDGYIYTIDMQTKTGTKMKVSDEVDYKNFDMRKLDGELKVAYEKAMANAKTETFLGKPCKVITMNDPETKSQSTMWIWKNIPLKYKINGAMGNIEVAASSIKETAVDAQMFAIPSDISFEEVNADVLQKQMEMLQQLQGQ